MPQQQLEMTPLKTEDSVPKSQEQQEITIKDQPENEPKMDNDTKQVIFSSISFRNTIRGCI